MIWARIFGAVPPALKWALVGLLGAVLLFGAGYWLGARDARQAAALNAAEGRINTREEIDNALDCNRDLPWADRLRACGE